MNERHTGFVRTRCPECGKLLRVEVVFPSWKEPFEDTIHTCTECGVELLLTDPHQYDENGHIIN